MTMQNVKDSVLKSLDASKRDMIEFMSNYLRYKSINHEMAKKQAMDTEVVDCQEWVARQFRDWKLFDNVECWGDDTFSRNVVAEISGESSGYGLMFNGHSDVVPVTEEQMSEWDRRSGPWSGNVIDGEIWGRGAADMKGGNVAAIFAVRSIAQLMPHSLKKGLTLSLVSTEETGAHEKGVDSIIRRGYIASHCILPEPTNMNITPKIGGEFYFKIVVKGQATHICKRHLCIHPSASAGEIPGANAIDKMRKILNAFQDLEDQWGIHRKSKYMPPGSMTLNVSQIAGGKNYSALADSCEVVGSVLFNPELSSQEVISELRECINSVAKTDYWMRANPPEIEIPHILDEKEPVNVADDDPLLSIMKDSYLEVAGQVPALVGSVGTSDGNYLAKQGIATIQLGLNEDGIHGKNEKASIADILNLSKIFALTIIDFCGVR